MASASKNLFSLEGQTAIITGASTGLGAGMAIALADAGADCVLVSRTPATETEQAVKKIGRKTLTISADMSKMESVDTVVIPAIETFGKIDILVNNAGTIRRAPVLEFSEKDWDDVMDVNSKSVFFLSQSVARDMAKRKKGKIINIASLLTFQGGIRVPSYAASKGAVGQITKALANELAGLGININAIAPGYMETNNTEQLRNDEVRYRSISDRIPAGRWGTPEDLAGAAIFLASSASDYVNGHVLVVDGGWMAR